MMVLDSAIDPEKETLYDKYRQVLIMTHSHWSHCDHELSRIIHDMTGFSNRSAMISARLGDH
jgi:hypothetical protein